MFSTNRDGMNGEKYSPNVRWNFCSILRRKWPRLVEVLDQLCRGLHMRRGCAA